MIVSNDKIRQNSYEKYLHITHIHRVIGTTIGEFPRYILQVQNHAFSDHPNKGRGDRDLRPLQITVVSPLPTRDNVFNASFLGGIKALGPRCIKGEKPHGRSRISDWSL